MSEVKSFANLHSLANTEGARSTAKRRGRGRASGLGKTSGRGHKGQYAHKGHKHKNAFEGGQMPLLRRIPKRGFKNPARIEAEPVNVDALNCFEEGATIDFAALFKAGLITRDCKRAKILGVGNITKKLTVKASAFSETAKSKIEAAGGTCECI